MMARMLSQLPLPLLPAGAAEIAPGVGLLAGEDGGLVAVHGLAAFAWDAGDEAGRPLAAVQLVRLRAASQGQVAEALHLEPGHLVNATAASAAEANNCRRADLAVIHPRCCHSRSASESPAITTSPNGMER